MMNEQKGVWQRTAKMKKQKIVVGGCLVVGLILVSFFTPLYNIADIAVGGNEQIDTQALIDASGITIGENIFKINIADAQKKISKVAFVNSVSVKRVLPNKIKITVTESMEVAYINFLGNYVGIDENGKMLEIKQQSDVDKPIIYGLHADNFEIGSRADLGDEKTQNALFDILSQFKASNLTDKILAVDLNDSENIIMMLRNGIEVKLGNSENLKYKVAYLKAVLDELGDVSGGVVNLADTENVTYRAE